MLLLTHILALVDTYISLGGYTKNVFRVFDKRHAKEFPENYMRGLHDAEQYHMSAIRFFLLSGLLTVEFFLLDLISRQVTSGLAGDIISTGIHIPVILMISGFFLKPSKLQTEDKKQILFLVTLTASIAFTVWNWRLGFLSIAIVAGKQVWIDFVLDFRISKIKKYFRMLKCGKEPVSAISRYCVSYLVIFSLFQIIVNFGRILNKSDKLIILCLITSSVLLWEIPFVAKKK